MTLPEYLAKASRNPWVWGAHDCSAFVARWAKIPLPSYGSKDEADSLMRDAGGLLPLFEAAAKGRADPVTFLEPGDVAVLSLLSRDGKEIEVGAIWSGQRWMFVPERGGIAGIREASVLKSWRPCCLRP